MSAILDIVAKLSNQASGPAQALAKDLGAVDKAADAGDKSVGTLGNTLDKGLAIGAGIAVAGVTLLAKGLWDSVEAAGEAQSTVASLDATIQSTGRTGETSSEELYAYADSLKQTAIYGDDAIASGLGVLVGFQQISEETRNNAAPVMLDMAGKFGGVQGAADKLGAALNDFDGFTKVSRQIGGFTAEQEAMFASFKEANDLIGYQDYLLNLLSQRFGGQAAAAAGTFAGKMEIIKDRFGEVQEVAGEKLLPALTALADEVIPQLEQAAEDLGPIIDEIASENLPAMVDSASELIQTLPVLVDNLDEAYRALKLVYDIVFIIPNTLNKVGVEIRELTEEIDAQAEHTGEVTHQVGVYTNSVIRLENTIRGHTKTVTAEGNAYDYLIPRVEETEVATVALSGAYDYMIGVAERTENQMETYRGELGEVTAAQEAAETAALALAAAEAELATQTGAYFDQALTATGETESLEMMLYNASAAAGLYAGDLAIAAGNTGEFTDAQITAAFETANMRANIDLLVASVQGGTISMNEATEALDLLKAGEVDTAAEAIPLVASLDETYLALTSVTGEAIDAGEALTAIPREIDVHIGITSDPIPTLPGGGGGPPGGPGDTPAFASGGFTGYGSMNEIAGYVHRNEYVLNAAAVGRMGLSNLEAINSGRSAGVGGGDTIINIAVDARWSTDPAATEIASYRGTQRALAEVGQTASIRIRTR